jgi:hypothetical protein
MSKKPLRRVTVEKTPHRRQDKSEMLLNEGFKL